MTTTRQPDVSKSEPLYIEQLTSSQESSSIEANISDKDAEKRLLRKLDMRIVPILWLMFMLAFLDRTNVCYSIPRADSTHS
jgi:hypothetical protein